MEHQSNIVFRRVRERDIDLLLLEEMCCSPKFLNWFFEEITKQRPKGLTMCGAKHSLVHGLGQTDIEVTIDDAGRKSVFLIENKIGRTKQRQQSLRYEQRRKLYKDDCRVVLVLPERFGTESFVEGYPHILWLEDVLKWLRTNEAGDPRSQFKIALLSQALNPVPLPEYGKFRAQYVELAQHPEYRLLRLPTRGKAIAFNPEGLPPRVRLVHRIRQGRVELIFRGKRNEFNRLRAALDSLTHAGFKVWPYPTACAMFTEVPQVFKDMDFEPEEVTQALDAALELWKFFLKNEGVIMASVS